MIQKLKAVVAVFVAATTVASADEVAALFGKAEYTGDVTALCLVRYSATDSMT